MPKSCAPEFRRRVVNLCRAGRAPRPVTSDSPGASGRSAALGRRTRRSSGARVSTPLPETSASMTKGQLPGPSYAVCSTTAVQKRRKSWLSVRAAMRSP
jgi:hypothetical protein